MVAGMTRFRALLFVLVLVAVAVPATATSADRMLVGFQDDPSFRWLDTRDANLTTASETGASIISHDRLLEPNRDDAADGGV